MKKKIKPLHTKLGCAGLLVAGIVASFLGVKALTSVTGRPYFDIPSDRAKLRKIREPLLAVPPALEAHRKIHGDYPDQISDLDSSVPRLAEVQAAFRNTSVSYRTDGLLGYNLYLKLNWDGGLYYPSDPPRWVYDAGQGGEGTSWTIDR